MKLNSLWWSSSAVHLFLHLKWKSNCTEFTIGLMVIMDHMWFKSIFKMWLWSFHACLKWLKTALISSIFINPPSSLLWGFVQQFYSNVLSSAGWGREHCVCWQGIYMWKLLQHGIKQLYYTAYDKLAIRAHCSEPAILLWSSSRGKPLYSLVPSWPSSSPSLTPKGILLLLGNRKRRGWRPVVLCLYKLCTWCKVYKVLSITFKSVGRGIM